MYSRNNREYGDDSLGSPGKHRIEKTGLSSRYQPERANELNSPKPRFDASCVYMLVGLTTSYESIQAESSMYGRNKREHGDDNYDLGSPGVYRADRTGDSGRYKKTVAMTSAHQS